MFKIYSFTICPFVQRSIITMKYKKIPYEVKYIDLANRPIWFLEISPLGKVPVLETENGVLFESGVINEYINETSEGSLLSNDPFKKARQRAYIEISNNITGNFFKTAMARDEEDYLKCKLELENNLTFLLSEYRGPFFTGKDFSLVDTSIIPVLQRIVLTNNLYDDLNLSSDNKEKLEGWIESSMELKEVQDSVLDSFEEEYKSYLVKGNSFIHTKINNSPSSLLLS